MVVATVDHSVGGKAVWTEMSWVYKLARNLVGHLVESMVDVMAA